jgi:hypothetical protein
LDGGLAITFLADCWPQLQEDLVRHCQSTIITSLCLQQMLMVRSDSQLPIMTNSSFSPCTLQLTTICCCRHSDVIIVDRQCLPVPLPEGATCFYPRPQIQPWIPLPPKKKPVGPRLDPIRKK